MKLILFSLLAAILIFGIPLTIITILQKESEVNEPQIEYIPERIVSNYIDTTGYYDTVVFTEEDSILSIY